MDLKAIEERANKATPGPWVIVWSQLMEHHGAAFNPWRRVLVGLPKPEGAGKNVLTAKYVTEVTQLAQTDEQDAQAVSDGRFIAHAREDIPALVARVKELEDAMGLVLGWLERENPNAIAAVTLRRALNPTVSDTPSGRGVKA